MAINHLYIHIPFCKTKCIYCDFYSECDLHTENLVIDKIISEIEFYKYRLNNKQHSIFIGGGTPSLLSFDNFTKLGNYLKPFLKSTTEFTIEINPDDVIIDKIKCWQDNGVNRFSVGIQTLDDMTLKMLNRRHDSKIAFKALELLSKNKLQSQKISCDLIYDIPNSGVQTTANEIKTIINDFNINHFSAYSLTLDPTHSLFNLQPSEDQSIETIKNICAIADKNNFSRYEISNFSKEKNYCIHNLAIWKGAEYLGVGPSAVSTFKMATDSQAAINENSYIRKENTSSIADFLAKDFHIEGEVINQETRNLEILMTEIRTKWGVKFSNLKISDQELSNLITQGSVKTKNTRTALTALGQDICEGITPYILKHL